MEQNKLEINLICDEGDGGGHFCSVAEAIMPLRPKAYYLAIVATMAIVIFAEMFVILLHKHSFILLLFGKFSQGKV